MALPKLLFDSRFNDATPVASSTAAGTNVLNLRGCRPFAWWKPAAVPAYVDVDSGRSSIADAIAIIGHDLGSKQAEVALFASDWPFGSNLWTFPEDFTNAAWTKANVTVANTSAVTAPDGTATADLVTETAINDFHHVARNTAVADSSSYTAAVFAKAGTARYVWMEAQDKAGSFAHYATFDLQTGTVTTSVGCTATITPVGGINTPGVWFECAIVYGSASGATPSPTVFIGIMNGSGAPVGYLGNTGNYLYLWGARLQAAEAPVPYVAVSGWMDAGRAVWAARKNVISTPENPAVGAGGWFEYQEPYLDVVRTALASPARPSAPAWKVMCRTANSVQRQVGNSFSADIPADTVVCCSASLKAAEVSIVQLSWTSKAGNFPGVYFNLATGATSITTSGGESPLAYGITAEGDGWYRCWAAFSSKTGGSNCGPNWIMQTSMAGGNVTGPIGAGFLFAAPKIEFGGAPTAYVPQSNPPIFGAFARSVGRYRRLYVAGAAAPSLAVVMVGEAMELPVGLEYPFDAMGRKPEGESLRNSRGQLLGRLIDFEEWEETIKLRQVPRAWVKGAWAPAWGAHLRSKPFVLAWNPDYADEVRLVEAVGGYDAPEAAGARCDLSARVRGVA